MKTNVNVYEVVSIGMNKNTQIRGGKEQKLYLTKCKNKSRTRIVEGQKRTNQGTSISSSLPSSSSSLRPASSMNESATCMKTLPSMVRSDKKWSKHLSAFKFCLQGWWWSEVDIPVGSNCYSLSWKIIVLLEFFFSALTTVQIFHQSLDPKLHLYKPFCNYKALYNCSHHNHRTIKTCLGQFWSVWFPRSEWIAVCQASSKLWWWPE